jgi:pSer/pThr/pTyr-binding forkhead associated (FHA) protein
MIQQFMQRFLNECGCSGPIQLVAQNPTTGDTLRRSLEQPFAIIGRNPKADVSLADEEVSHRHTYLQIYDGRVFCLDLKSRTGTHWDDGPQDYGWLEGKQTIRIGSYRVKLMDAGLPASLHAGESGNQEAPLLSRRLKDLALGGVSLEFMPRNGDPEIDEPLGRWKMQRVLALVGRSPTCKVRLVHPSVSRIHCSLVRTPLGLWVIDLLGRKGTLVNGIPVPWALLQEGDRLQVGRFLICVRYDNPRDMGSGQVMSGEWSETRSANANHPPTAHPPSDTPIEIEEETSDSPSNIVLLSSAPQDDEDRGSRIEDRHEVLSPISDEDDEDREVDSQMSKQEPDVDVSPIPPVAISLSLPETEGLAENEGRDSVAVEIEEREVAYETAEPGAGETARKEPNVAVSPARPVAVSPTSAPTGSLTKRERALVRSLRRLPDKAVWMEEILPAIADQFAQMQQQMFDQFQQAMVVMFRTFGQLHREQMEMVRRELDRVHQLTQQLHELQMELAKHPAAASNPVVQEMLAALPPISTPAQPSPTSGAKEEEPTLPLPPDQPWEAALNFMIEEGRPKIEEPTTPRDSEEPLRIPERESADSILPVASASEDQGRKARRGRRRTLANRSAEDSAEYAGVPASPSQVHSRSSDSKENEDRESRIKERETASAPAPNLQHQSSDSPDIHVLLCQQIAALQEERQSRWQRILNFLTGKPRGEPMP